MGKDWPHCIVTVIDVIGIKDLAKIGDSRASTQMRRLHALTRTAFYSGMPMHAHSYCWNDSVLLLAYWNQDLEAARSILAEASKLKRNVDSQIDKSYAISVKGQAFPETTSERLGIPDEQSRCTILRASSYAFANCYQIEAEAKRNRLRASWYIDSRLEQAIDRTAYKEFSMTLLPGQRNRRILLFNDYIA